MRGREFLRVLDNKIVCIYVSLREREESVCFYVKERVFECGYRCVGKSVTFISISEKVRFCKNNKKFRNIIKLN